MVNLKELQLLWFKQLRVNICIATVSILSVTPLAVHAQINKTFTEPVTTSEIAAAEEGIVKRILVSEGQFVKQNEIIAELDCEIWLMSLRLAKAKADSVARINSAKAKLKARTRMNENLQQLKNEGHANPHEVQKALAEYEIALAELEFAEDERRIAQFEVDRIVAQRERRVIRSPFDGVVSELHKEIGEYISSNEPQLATMVQLSRLKARFYLLDSQVVDLKVGQKVRIAIGEQSSVAQIVFVSPIIDPDSRTVRVDVLIDNQDGKFTSGVTCEWLHGHVVERTSTNQTQASNR